MKYMVQLETRSGLIVFDSTRWDSQEDAIKSLENIVKELPYSVVCEELGYMSYKEYLELNDYTNAWVVKVED